MKLLHVYKDFDPPVSGGIERHVALTCRFQRAHADVEALVCRDGVWTRACERDGTPVTEAGAWFRFQGAPAAPAFPWLLRRARADIVVVHMPNPTAELSWLLARPKAALVVRYHSDVVRQAAAMRVYAPVQRRFLAAARLILPTSQAYLDTSAMLAPFRGKCRPMPLGVVPDDFAEADPGAVAALHARYGNPFVLFTGRHRYYKGLAYLVEAARWINAPVVIAGDGPERPRIQRLAASLGAPVHFPGHLDDAALRAHLHACAVFAFPSVARSEAFGMSIMEAHACGVPAVATRLGTGVEFINEDGKTGLNVPPRDPRALAEAINQLIGDPEARRAMGSYARARIAREFDARAIAEQELKLYQELLT